jgi:tetratricopeptide (TPR) repeat protein
LWLVGGADVLLVGTSEPLGAQLAGISRHWNRPGVASDLRDISVRTPSSLLSLFVAEGRDLARYAAAAQLQTDDRGGLEFSGPRSIFGRQINENSEKLRALARTATAPALVQAATSEAGPGALRDRAWMFLRAEAYDDAWRDFVRAVEMDPSDAGTYPGLIRAAMASNRNRVEETLTRLKRLAEEKSSIEAQLAVSRLLATRGAIEEAAAVGLDLAKHHPDDIRVLEQVASVFADGGDVQRLQPIMARLRQLAPANEVTRYYSAALLFMQGRSDLAVPDLELVVRENPKHARAQNLLGAALASLGERGRARRAFEASLRADPLDPGTYTNLGTLEMEEGNRLAAGQRYAEALALDPTSEGARRGLAQATSSH